MVLRACLFVACSISALSVSSAFAANLPVASCVEFAGCYFGLTPTPFTKTFSSSDLGLLGLGETKDLFVVQTSPFIIRLGVTTFDFATPSGDVITTLPEFNGPGSFDPAVLTVGTFFVPTNATALTISGTFGNTFIPNSAGADVFLGIASTVNPVPLPASAPMFGAALLAVGVAGYGMKRKAKAAA